MNKPDRVSFVAGVAVGGPKQGGTQGQEMLRLAARVWQQQSTLLMSVIWTIIIGFVAGVIAKFIMPGDNEPSGFILTTILGIVGAFVATYIGQSLGWYRPGEGAGLLGAIVGAVIVLLVYGLLAGRRRTV
jgi:uncharacterized membrane protein YeaQ/YmgE (transglycosylase-associated protein family)